MALHVITVNKGLSVGIHTATLRAIRLQALPVVLGVFLFSTILGCIVPVQAAAAQTAPERRLKIYPLRKEVNIRPGTAYKGSFTLENTGTKPITVQLSAEAFDVKDDSYDYIFVPESKVSDWVHFATTSIELEPKATYPVKYIVNVPIGTEPGGAYISLFGASIPSPDASIESIDRVGSLLYITIPGDITKTGSLLSFSSPLVGITTAPWSATVRNAGTAHFTTDYTMNIRTLWGSDVSHEEGSSLILPRSVRLLQGSLQPPAWLGLYVIHYNIPLGDNGNAVGTRPYVYLPLGQALALAALLIGCVLFVRATRTRQKKNQQSPQRADKKTKKEG